MLSGSDVKRSLALPPHTPSAQVIPVLKRYEESLHDVEKGAFHLLEALSQEYPENNLRQLFDIVRPEHLKILQQDEQKIIDRIRTIGTYLSPASEEKLAITLNEAENFIKNDDHNSIFKRRMFIGKIGDVTTDLPEKDIGDTIFKIAHEMPRAGNSQSAFIVKYSEKNPANGVERDSHSIIQGILMPSVGTIEHVKARSPLVKKGGGANEMKNYMLECSQCNGMRNCMDFKDFVNCHPEFFGVHAQRYIDAIIERLNRGELYGFERYPLQISRTLRRQSKGKVKLDISKLNLPEHKIDIKG